MYVTEKDLEYLALMSRIELSGEEKNAYTRYLNEVMGFLDGLNKADFSGIEPAAHVLHFANVFREDNPEPSLEKERALANAPEIEAGSFKVPRII